MLSFSKSFHKNLNCASTANIEEVMKFFNPGDKTFETDFIRECVADHHSYYLLNSKVTFLGHYIEHFEYNLVFQSHQFSPNMPVADYCTYYELHIVS